MQINEHALKIIQTLQQQGYTALLAGGCVRDWLLGRAPQDWDIATSAPPAIVEKIFPQTIAIGKNFGVIVVIIDGAEFEVATFRTDGDYHDGRRPATVTFSTPAIDAARRDFTINAMFYDPLTERLFDYTGGQADLAKKIIRTVGDAECRFREDHLRILRAVRFAARLDFTLAEKTAAAMRELAPLAAQVSGERLGEELTKIFTTVGAARGLSMLAELKLLDAVLPEVAALQGVEQPPEFHPEGDVFQHTLLMMTELENNFCAKDFLAEPSARTILSWATLLHDIGKPPTRCFTDRWRFNEHDVIGAAMADTILQRLKMPTKIRAAVHELILRHMHFIALPKMRVAKRRRFLQDPLFALHLQLHYLDCVASHNLLAVYEYARREWEHERSQPPPPRRLLTGKDLLALGYPAGKLFSEILFALEDARLEGKITTPVEARIWLAENFPKNS